MGASRRFDAVAFDAAVAEVLKNLRSGEVVTYGEVAAEAGFPGHARSVGRFLAQADGAYPWWRVVNAAGRLVPGHEEMQATKLRDEGVEVNLTTKRIRLSGR